jgi:hypothetical protein
MNRNVSVAGFDKDGEPEVTWDEATGSLEIHFNFMPPLNNDETRRFDILFEGQFAKLLSKQAGKKVTQDDREVFVATKVKEPRLTRLVAFLESFWTDHAQIELARFLLKKGKYAVAFSEIKHLGGIPDELQKEALNNYHSGYFALQYIPELLVDTKKLEIIPDDANVTTLPPGIEQCRKLQKLMIWDMEKIDIRRTIEQLAGLPKLKHLDFTDCRFDTFPDNITSLKKVKVLISSNNGLTSLPDCLADMPKLKNLRVYEEDTLTRSHIKDFKKRLQKQNKKIDFDSGGR